MSKFVCIRYKEKYASILNIDDAEEIRLERYGDDKEAVLLSVARKEGQDRGFIFDTEEDAKHAFDLVWKQLSK